MTRPRPAALWTTALALAASAHAAGTERFFDDFGAYADTAALQREGGWTVRQGRGHPGVEGARWGGGEAVTLVDDASRPGNRLLQLNARTDGTGPGTTQAQLCHARKSLAGTYAARVRFADEPVAGADGDPVIQTFYAVSPLRHDLDPDFSELDWEYLANGGWGAAQTRLYSINWQTVRLEPWQAWNQPHEEPGSFAGWHVLMMQVDAAAGHTRWFVDGRQVAGHGGRNQPVQPMAISFSLWFSPGGLLPASAEPRVWREQVDWVFHARGELLSLEEVQAAVEGWRHAGVQRHDGVAAAQPPLASPCDF